MAAPFGNQYNLKLHTPELKKIAYDSYCKHLSEGRGKKSWRLREVPGTSLTWETMEKYLKNEHDFDPLQKQEAMSDGLYVWESLIRDSAFGVNKDANTATIQMTMRNMYGWDKKEEREELVPEDLKSAYESLMTQLALQQKGSSIEIYE